MTKNYTTLYAWPLFKRFIILGLFFYLDIIWEESNTRPLDSYDQKQGKDFHTSYHQDCLVWGMEGDQGDQNKKIYSD